MQSDELTIGFIFILAAALPALGVLGWRRLRNLDALEAAQRQARIAIKMACESQEVAKASQAQLAVCRGLLAVAMRERDYQEMAVDVLARKLARLEQERRHERAMARTWLTRTITDRKVSEN